MKTQYPAQTQADLVLINIQEAKPNNGKIIVNNESFEYDKQKYIGSQFKIELPII